MHQCVALVTDKIKKHQKEGLPMLGRDGELHWVHVVLASYVADIEEQAKLALVKMFPAFYSDPSFLLHKNDFDNPFINLDHCPKREEAAARYARMLFEQSNGDEECLEYSELDFVHFEVRVKVALCLLLFSIALARAYVT